MSIRSLFLPIQLTKHILSMLGGEWDNKAIKVQLMTGWGKFSVQASTWALIPPSRDTSHAGRGLQFEKH